MMKNNFIYCAFADEAGNSLSEQISAMLENGISGLEIRGINGKNVTALTEKEAVEINSRLKDNGLFVWSIGSPLGKINITDDFNSHLEVFKRTIELSHLMECSHMRIFSFFIPGGDDPSVYRDEVMERLSLFCEASEGSGILLCHENEKAIYGDTAERCLDILQNFPQIRSVFDPANFIQCKVDTLKAWDLISGYTEYLHIKDALSDGSVVPPGCGTGNLKKIISDYRNMGKNVLTIEPHLSVFEGLSSLEREGDKSIIGNYAYSSKTEAFNAAVSALNQLIDGL